MDLNHSFTLDFILLSNDTDSLRSISIQDFLLKNLGLELHPRKVIISKLTQGIDFLGYILFPNIRS